MGKIRINKTKSITKLQKYIKNTKIIRILIGKIHKDIKGIIQMSKIKIEKNEINNELSPRYISSITPSNKAEIPNTIKAITPPNK